MEQLEYNSFLEDIDIKSEITIETEISEETLVQLDLSTGKLSKHDLMKKFQLKPAENEDKDCNLYKNDHNIDLNLSAIMSEHNYTSQEDENPENIDENFKKVLLQNIIRSTKSTSSALPQIMEFVENILVRIKHFEFKIDKNCNNENENNGKLLLGLDKEVLENNKQLPNFSNKVPHPLIENCSELLELEQYIDFLDNSTIKKSMGETETKNILLKIMDFAKSLYDDCNSWISAANNIDSKIKIYLKEQVTNLKAILKETTHEKSVQTNFDKLSKKRKRMNYKAKRKLLLDTLYTSGSESEDSSQSLLSNSSDSESTNLDSNKESKLLFIENLQINDKTSFSQEYDDGIDISKYIQSDIFEFEYRNSPSTQCESDKENRSKQVSCDNETEKEIDRLTNLSGFNKRQVNGHLKGNEHDKPKTKALHQKNSKIIDMFGEDIVNLSSCESSSHSEQEITENEFKSRFNAYIKDELLNDSSSGRDITDEDDNDSQQNNCDEDDLDNEPLVVEKFLENFKIDESEPDDLEDESDNNNDNLNKTDRTPDADKSGSESLSERLMFKKKSKAKTFEKIFTETDKRNSNEEIVLSSASEYSDVEAVDVEPTGEKTRIIKPMLRQDQLANETRKAQKLETERIRRLEKQQLMLSKVIRNSNNEVKKDDVILDYNEETKTFIKVDPDIVKHLKPHQIDGVKFMYETCYGGVEALKKSQGSGCILAHCMGLGKTLQLIALIHTVVSYDELKTNKVLVLCPKSTVMNWADEFHRWLGPLNKDKHLKMYTFADPCDIKVKLEILKEWSKSTVKRAGCLLLGYEAFRSLIFFHSYKPRGNISADMLKDIRDSIEKHLLDPGADIVVCDEGHIIKNSKSAISLAVSQIKTSKRIILTGTPIQNNLKEYYSMVNFIKPLYLGTEKEFANLYANPIKNGQHKDSSKKDIKVMKQRSFVLHKKLSKFVQRKEAELLKTFLPQKYEYVLFVPMTSVQNKLYEYILEAIMKRGDYKGKSLITDYTCLRKIWTHPRVLQYAWQNATDLKMKSDQKKKEPHSDDDQPDDIYDSHTGVMSVTNDWWRKLLTNSDLETILPSNKMRAMFEILRMCEEKDEKCLIFSAFVAVLNVVEFFFKKITKKDPEILQHISFNPSKRKYNTWENGQDYYRLDGKTPKTIRHEMIKRFNSSTNTRTRVFLISSKAGGQGINLTGANRVIILDTSWNPSNDQQNIFRIFRLGQQKNCYIYRLIAMGTMEEKVYSRSVTKQAMSFRVVDEQQIDRHYNMAELAELYTLTTPEASERPMPVLPKDSILASLLLNHPEVVYKYHEHDSLLENKVEQELSEQEKADAWAAYERELQTNLEHQGLPNTERLPNNFLPANLSHGYNNPLNRLDPQVLAYNMYNYTNTQYIESLCRSFAINFPDVSTSIHNAAYPSSFNSANLSKNSNINMLGNLQSAVNPLQSLNNLNMLGLGSQHIFGHNNPINSSSTLPIGHLPSFASPSLATNLNVPLSNNSFAAGGLAQYKNIAQNFINYAGVEFAAMNRIINETSNTSAINQISNLHKSSSNAQDASISAASQVYSESEKVVQKDPIFNNGRDNTKSTVAKRLNNDSIEVVQKVTAANNVPDSQFSIHSNDIKAKQILTQVISPPGPILNVNSSNSKNCEPFSTATTVNYRPKINMPITSTQQRIATSDTVNKNSVNMGIMYPNDTTAKSKDLLKANNEMQIIPTTSPPGTISITKQLNEISPSISLTAVRNMTSKSSSTVGATNSINRVQQKTDSFTATTATAVKTTNSSTIATTETMSVSDNVKNSKNAIGQSTNDKLVVASDAGKSYSLGNNIQKVNVNSKTNSETNIHHMNSASLQKVSSEVRKTSEQANTSISRKNVKSIRSIDSQPKPSGTGVYNINDKRITLGGSAKSDSTVSNLSMERKRNQDITKIDLDLKRRKLNKPN